MKSKKVQSDRILRDLRSTRRTAKSSLELWEIRRGLRQAPKKPKLADLHESLALKMRDPMFVYRLLMNIYGGQTNSEKRLGVSLYKNRKGFTKVDAPLLSSIALKAQKRGHLVESELAILLTKDKNGFPKLVKYHRQNPDIPNLGPEVNHA